MIADARMVMLSNTIINGLIELLGQNMDAFESLVATLLKREGYWTTASLKVELTKAEKRRIGRPSAPRWELDIVAYKGATNELLAVECKSYLDSTGVVFRDGKFEPEKLYKLFSDTTLRRVVLGRLAKQLVAAGTCGLAPRVTLCLAVGNIARKSDRKGLSTHFSVHRWCLFDEHWIVERLRSTAKAAYENEVALVVTKLILRNERGRDGD